MSNLSGSPGPIPEHSLPFNSLQSPPPTSKRKRDDDEEIGVEMKLLKPAKRKRAKIPKPIDEDLDLDQGLNFAIGKLDRHLLADYVAQRHKRFSPGLSIVELEDKHIPEQAFYDTSGWEKPRNLNNMSSFLDRYVSNTGGRNLLSLASEKTGSPHTLVVTSAGLRAADITRALRIFQTKNAAVAKLFAKHIKLKDAINYVKQTRMGIGVGTPSRIIDLLDSGALTVSKLKRVVVDVSHIDQKKRGIFDIREIQQPLMALLNRSELKDNYGSDINNIKLMFY